MKNLSLIKIVIIVVSFFLLFQNSTAQPVTWHEAKRIAINISNELFNKTDDSDTPIGMSIGRVEFIRYNNKVIGYIFCFNPKGYVIVSRSRSMRPYFTATGHRTFETDKNTIESFLKPAFTNEYLAVANQSLPQNQVSRNRNLWKHYLAED